MKIFIAGARSIVLADSFIYAKLNSICEHQHQIIVGDCHGVDAMVQQYLAERQYQDVVVYASNGRPRNNIGKWNVTNVPVPSSMPRYAFYRQKDIAMAEDADYGFMIWDGVSRGTAQNILTLARQGKKVLIYNPHTKNQAIVRSYSDAQQLVLQ